MQPTRWCFVCVSIGDGKVFLLRRNKRGKVTSVETVTPFSRDLLNGDQNIQIRYVRQTSESDPLEHSPRTYRFLNVVKQHTDGKWQIPLAKTFSLNRILSKSGSQPERKQKGHGKHKRSRLKKSEEVDIRKGSIFSTADSVDSASHDDENCMPTARVRDLRLTTSPEFVSAERELDAFNDGYSIETEYNSYSKSYMSKEEDHKPSDGFPKDDRANNGSVSFTGKSIEIVSGESSSQTSSTQFLGKTLDLTEGQSRCTVSCKDITISRQIAQSSEHIATEFSPESVGNAPIKTRGQQSGSITPTKIQLATTMAPLAPLKQPEGKVIKLPTVKCTVQPDDQTNLCPTDNSLASPLLAPHSCDLPPSTRKSNACDKKRDLTPQETINPVHSNPNLINPNTENETSNCPVSSLRMENGTPNENQPSVSCSTASKSTGHGSSHEPIGIIPSSNCDTCNGSSKDAIPVKQDQRTLRGEFCPTQESVGTSVPTALYGCGPLPSPVLGKNEEPEHEKDEGNQNTEMLSPPCGDGEQISFKETSMNTEQEESTEPDSKHETRLSESRKQKKDSMKRRSKTIIVLMTAGPDSSKQENRDGACFKESKRDTAHKREDNPSENDQNSVNGNDKQDDGGNIDSSEEKGKRCSDSLSETNETERERTERKREKLRRKKKYRKSEKPQSHDMNSRNSEIHNAKKDEDKSTCGNSSKEDSTRGEQDASSEATEKSTRQGEVVTLCPRECRVKTAVILSSCEGSSKSSTSNLSDQASNNPTSSTTMSAPLREEACASHSPLTKAQDSLLESNVHKRMPKRQDSADIQMRHDADTSSGATPSCPTKREHARHSASELSVPFNNTPENDDDSKLYSLPPALCDDTGKPEACKSPDHHQTHYRKCRCKHRCHRKEHSHKQVPVSEQGSAEPQQISTPERTPTPCPRAKNGTSVSVAPRNDQRKTDSSPLRPPTAALVLNSYGKRESKSPSTQSPITRSDDSSCSSASRSKFDITDSHGRIGDNLDVSCVSFSVVECAEGDLIICASDGVHDNMDPEVLGHVPRDLGIDADCWNDAPGDGVRAAKQEFTEATIARLANAAPFRRRSSSESLKSGKSSCMCKRSALSNSGSKDGSCGSLDGSTLRDSSDSHPRLVLCSDPCTTLQQPQEQPHCATQGDFQKGAIIKRKGSSNFSVHTHPENGVNPDAGVGLSRDLNVSPIRSVKDKPDTPANTISSISRDDKFRPLHPCVRTCLQISDYVMEASKRSRRFMAKTKETSEIDYIKHPGKTDHYSLACVSASWCNTVNPRDIIGKLPSSKEAVPKDARERQKASTFDEIAKNFLENL